MESSAELKFTGKGKKEGGIYIHVPYCTSRCGYCAFFTAGKRLADWDTYIRGVTEELRVRIGECPEKVMTIYFGGGTPSLLPSGKFLGLISEIKRIIKEGGKEWRVEEFTVEANPDDVTAELVRSWRQAGVNRVSLGVQSFKKEELKVLERKHEPEHVERALSLLKNNFDNISLDLIFGIPGQSLEDWRYSVKAALKTGVTHISAYSLSYEERTLLTHRRNSGQVKEADETDTGAMYRELLRLTAEAGYIHYEVSNFALPGYESKHNSSYWSGAPYLGLGPSASSYDGMRRRFTNSNILKDWIGKGEREELDDEDLKTEYILTRLRKREGINLVEFENLFGQKAKEKLVESAASLLSDGKMQVKEGRIYVCGEGWLIHDYICAELI